MSSGFLSNGEFVSSTSNGATFVGNVFVITNITSVDLSSSILITSEFVANAKESNSISSSLEFSFTNAVNILSNESAFSSILSNVSVVGNLDELDSISSDIIITYSLAGDAEPLSENSISGNIINTFSLTAESNYSATLFGYISIYSLWNGNITELQQIVSELSGNLVVSADCYALEVLQTALEIISSFTSNANIDYGTSLLSSISISSVLTGNISTSEVVIKYYNMSIESVTKKFTFTNVTPVRTIISTKEVLQ